MRRAEKFEETNKIICEINLNNDFNKTNSFYGFANSNNYNYYGNFIKKPIKKPWKKNHKWIGLVNTVYEYMEYTKVNGMHYLSRGVTNGFTRILWTIIEAIVLALCFFMMFLLYHKYLDSPTRMTIGKPIPILKVPYPAVTICHPQNVMDYKVDQFIANIQLPAGTDYEEFKNILPLVGGITERQWTTPNITQLHKLHTIFQINNLTIYQAVLELGTTCEDFIIKCQWNGKEFPCFQRTAWTTSTSHLGVCCSFNYYPNNSSFIPFSSNTYGIRGGLSVIGTGWPQISDGKSGAIYSAGFMILIHYPRDFATEGAPFTLLEMGTETYVDIYPTDSSCSSQVLALPIKQRKCITSSDVEYLASIDYKTTVPDGGIAAYRQSECRLKCYRKFVYGKCHCHPYQLPREDFNIRDCDVLDIPCFSDNYYLFKQIKCNYCLPSCSDVTYKVSTYITNFKAEHLSVNQFYRHANLTKTDFIAHIYLTGQTAVANRKIVVMSWISLLANLGGCFNLGVGLSLISIFEIFVAIFVRYRIHVNIAKAKPQTPTIGLQIFSVEQPRNNNN